MFWKPARLLSSAAPIVDVGVGGVRVYSDDPPNVGTRVELDLFLPDGEEVAMLVQVVWVNALPDGAPAPFDVGLRFLDVEATAMQRVMRVLERAEPS